MFVRSFWQLIVWSALFILSGAQALQADLPAARRQRLEQRVRLFEVWLDAKLAYEHIPGVAVGLVFDQELVWSKGFGYADAERQVAMTPGTHFGICSISKLFTAIAVMQLRDQGKLRLDDPVSQYLPYFKLQAPEGPPVTIRALLTHTSGLPREAAQHYWDGPKFQFPKKEELIAGLAGLTPLYPAERYYQYSNLGLTLAGEIVERVSGLAYETYVQERILTPLRLARTTPFMPESERGKSLAVGYGPLTRAGIREVMPFYQACGLAPAAGFASTVGDLASFASWQFRLLANGGSEVLRADTLREMQRVQWVDPDWQVTRGLGFNVRREGGNTLVSHFGYCPGFHTEITLIPKRKLAVVTMVNAMGVNIGEISTQLLRIVGEAVEAPLPGPDQPVGGPEFEKYCGLYNSVWGEFAIVPWRDGLAAIDLPCPAPLDSLTRLKHEKGDSFRRIREDDGEAGEEIVFETDANGRVAGLRWHGAYSCRTR
jgi:CubicO group peptidase (beta-lactamase class C family)